MYTFRGFNIFDLRKQMLRLCRKIAFCKMRSATSEFVIQCSIPASVPEIEKVHERLLAMLMDPNAVKISLPFVLVITVGLV